MGSLEVTPQSKPFDLIGGGTEEQQKKFEELILMSMKPCSRFNYFKEELKTIWRGFINGDFVKEPVKVEVKKIKPQRIESIDNWIDKIQMIEDWLKSQKAKLINFLPKAFQERLK